MPSGMSSSLPAGLGECGTFNDFKETPKVCLEVDETERDVASFMLGACGFTCLHHEISELSVHRNVSTLVSVEDAARRDFQAGWSRTGVAALNA